MGWFNAIQRNRLGQRLVRVGIMRMVARVIGRIK
jgi:hypothetical protein